jgi:hypothetical protein
MQAARSTRSLAMSALANLVMTTFHGRRDDTLEALVSRSVDSAFREFGRELEG